MQNVCSRPYLRRLQLWGQTWMRSGESTRVSWESSRDWSRDMTTSGKWVCWLRFEHIHRITFDTLTNKRTLLWPLNSSQQRIKGHRRTDSAQSQNFEPPSPTLLSPQSLTPLSISPFPSAFPSPEEVRRISVTSPTFERRISVWRSEAPMVRGFRGRKISKKEWTFFSFFPLLFIDCTLCSCLH